VILERERGSRVGFRELGVGPRGVHGLVYKEDHGPAMLKKEKEGKERGDGMCMCKKWHGRPPLFVKLMRRSKEQIQTCMLTKDECCGCFARMVA
jgi:hypothetical protein